MSNPKNELLEFLGGIVMLAAGLFIFSQKVMVYSGFFGAGYSIGRFNVTSGMVIIPFIIGIIWMFATGSLGSKIFTALSVLFIIISVIMSTHISLVTMSMFEWVLILVLIFGGLGLTAKALFGGNKRGK